MFVKSQPCGSDTPLAAEAANLRWCVDRLPVPTVLGYGVSGSTEFLILSSLSGSDGARAMLEGPQGTVARQFVDAMRRWHATPAAQFPTRLRPDDEFLRITAALGTMQRIPRLRRTAEVLLAEARQLRSRWPETERYVLTHGDFSLPNVMWCGGTVSGYLDVGAMAVADPARDIARAIVSLRRNMACVAQRLVDELRESTCASAESVASWAAMAELTVNTRRLVAASVHEFAAASNRPAPFEGRCWT